MSRVVVTEDAVLGLDRCRRFLQEKGKVATRRAATAIARRFEQLETTPEIGRPVAEHAGLRELVIEFGESGYVALYRFEPDDDTAYILAFRHQKEAGY